MTEFKVGDRVRHKEREQVGVVQTIIPGCLDGGCLDGGCLDVNIKGRGTGHWWIKNVSPDWIGPTLTPEEDGVRSTIQPRDVDWPAVDRAVVERLEQTDVADDGRNDDPWEVPEQKFWDGVYRGGEGQAEMTPFEHTVRSLYAEAADLLLRKHQDYGPTNIARAPGGALNGLRVRLHDKTARLNHLLDSGQNPEFETLIDTLMDIANYGLIGVLVQRGDWPDE